MDPDHEALARVAAGDAEAFAPLVERHQERLLRLCTRLLHDDEEARDAAQEVFLKAFRAAASYRPRGQVFTWLYRIAVNHCLNRLRRRSVVRFFSFAERREDEEPAFDPPDPGAAPDRALEARRRWRATRRALAALPPGQRAVVVLAKFEGLAGKEIAAALGISEGAVESRLVRALRTLERAAAVRSPRRGAGATRIWGFRRREGRMSAVDEEERLRPRGLPAPLDDERSRAVWDGLEEPPFAGVPPGFAARVMARARAEARAPGWSWAAAPRWAKAAALVALAAGAALGAGLTAAARDTEPLFEEETTLAERYAAGLAEIVR